MSKSYVKKPIVVEAVQWLGTNADEIYDFVGEALSWDMSALLIHTLEGVHEANAGDWIIRGVKGEFYPCKPAIFEMTYEEYP